MPRHKTPARERAGGQNRFQLLPKLIGKGAYSNVYAALDNDAGGEVVAKRVDLSKLEDVFFHEIDIMQKLEHENIVKFIHQKRVGYSGYIYMEKVEGLNLYEYVNRIGGGNGLPIELAFEIFSQISSALDYMHSLGISHHDVKTENIVFDQTQGVSKLVDFGLAVYFNVKENIVSPGGSPLYSAPEVLLSQPHDPSLADIWSLGVVFYYMLAGHYPWNDVSTMDELIARVADKGNTFPVIQFPDTMSNSLRNLFNKIFALDPGSRPTIEQCMEVINQIKN